MISRAIAKYGIDSFKCEIIEECFSKDHMSDREKYWINKLQPFPKTGIGYNLTPGGEYGDITFGMNEKQYVEYCKKFQGIKNGMYKSGERGIHPKGFLGKHHSDDAKLKMSKALSGENNPIKKVFGLKKEETIQKVC